MDRPRPETRCASAASRTCPTETASTATLGQVRPRSTTLCQALNYSRHRQKQLENRTVRTGALDDDFAAMVLHDLVNRRKAQSNAFGFSIADEGLKEILAKW